MNSFESIANTYQASHDVFLAIVDNLLSASDSREVARLLEQARHALAEQIGDVDDETLARQIDYAAIELCDPELYERVVDHRLMVDLSRT